MITENLHVVKILISIAQPGSHDTSACYRVLVMLSCTCRRMCSQVLVHLAAATTTSCANNGNWNECDVHYGEMTRVAAAWERFRRRFVLRPKRTHRTPSTVMQRLPSYNNNKNHQYGIAAIVMYDNSCEWLP